VDSVPDIFFSPASIEITLPPLATVVLKPKM
jgi:hypothetical protein